jgi:hypothetical protein
VVFLDTLRQSRVTYFGRTDRTDLRSPLKSPSLRVPSRASALDYHVLYPAFPRQRASRRVLRSHRRPEGRCRHERLSSERSQPAATLQASDSNWCGTVQTCDDSEWLAYHACSGKVLLGTALSIASIETASICAQLNFDWCFIDAEHTPMRSAVFMSGPTSVVDFVNQSATHGRPDPNRPLLF